MPPRRPAPRAATQVAGLALGTALVLFGGCSADGDEVADARGAQVSDAAVEAGLDGEVAAFLATFARGPAATYEVVYTTDTGEQVTVSNSPPDRRMDVVSGGAIATSLTVAGEAFSCGPAAVDEAMTCTRTDALVEPQGVFSAGTIDDLRTALTARARDFVFGLRDTEVAGTAVRCLDTTVRTDRDRPELAEGGTLCISAEGVVLLLDQGNVHLEATSYTTTVGPGRFVRPDRTDP